MDIEALLAARTDTERVERLYQMFDEDSRLNGSPSARVEFLTTMRYIEKYLTPGCRILDVGAGTGSVSVELARAARLGTVYAVEKNPEALPLLEENRRRFGAWNLRIVPGEAPGALAALPAPDRVFVGGSSGGLLEILRTAKEKNPGVRAVVNTVTLETLAEAVPALKACGFPEPDVVQLSAARARKAGNYHLMTGQNPVFILSAGGETDA